MKKTLFFLILALPFFLSTHKIISQDCSPEIYSVPVSGDIEQTADGGYIIMGRVHNGPDTKYDLVVSKVDFLGNEVWTKDFGGTGDETAGSIRQTLDGGYVFVGTTEIIGGIGAAYVVKLDTNGNEEWSETLSDRTSASDVRQLPNGEYLIAGTAIESLFPIISFGLMIKMDNNGDVITEIKTNMWADQWDDNNWSWVDPGLGNGSFEAVNFTNDGGLIFTGSLMAGILIWPKPGNLFAVKTDANLNIEWQNNYYQKEGCEDYSTGIAVVQDAADNFYIADKTSFGGYDCTNIPGKIVKIGPDGLFIWRKAMPKHHIYALAVTDDGNLAGVSNNMLFKIDTSGTLIWQAEPVLPGFYTSVGYNMVQTTDKGFAFCGRRGGSGISEYLIIKYDSLGNVCSNFIEGTTYFDTNNNCEPDSVDLPFKNLIVEVNPGPIFTNSNSSGQYRFQLDTGNIELTIHPPNALWEIACPPDSTNYNFDTAFQIAGNQDFGLRPLADCPLMKVDLAVNRMRSCFAGNTFIYACNEGSATAQNVTVDLEWVEDLTVNSSSHPFIQNGNTLHFDLGEMTYGHCKTITIEHMLDCNAAIGDTICLSAKILPDNDCGPLPASSTDVVCRPVTNSFDPNEKQVDVNNLLRCWSSETDEFEYTLHYQNTGNDTAYRVVIIDTLPPELDIATVRTGVGSHPYEFEVRGNNVLIWTFDQINLVDSTTNEPGSQGLVQFSIHPKAGLSSTSINNWVAIYFDSNPAVITAWNDLPNCNATSADLEFVYAETGNAAFCSSDDGSISISAMGTGVLEYSIDGGGNWQNSSNFNSLPPGDYQLVISDESGMTASYPDNPVTIEIDDPQPLMEFGVFDLYNTCEVEGYVHVVSLAGGASFSLSLDGGDSFDPTYNDFYYEFIPAGSYHIILKNDCGFETDYGVFTFTDLTPPDIMDIEVTPPTSIMSEDGIIAVVINGDSLYHFSMDGFQTWQDSPVFEGLAPGIYQVVVRHAGTGCVSNSVEVEVVYDYIAPTFLEIHIIPITDCQGLGVIEIFAGGSEALEYSVDGGSTWQSDPVFPNLPAGDYIVWIRDATGMEVPFQFNPVAVELVGQPFITNVNTAFPSDCGLTDGIIQIEAVGGDTLFYSIDDGLTFQLENIFEQLPGGIYPILVQNECGVAAPVVTVDLVNPVLPIIDSIEITPATSPSADDGHFEVMVNAPSAVQFSIDGGVTWQTSPIFDNLAVGNYDMLISYLDGTCQVEEQNIMITFVTGTEEAPRRSTILLFPNPTTDQLTFALKGFALEDIHGVLIFNALGEIVHRQSSLESNTMDVSHLVSGSYFMKMETRKGFLVGRFEKM